MSEEIHVKVTRSGNRRFLIMYFDDPASGKRLQRSTKQTRRKDAEKEAGKWEAELREGRYKPPSKVTWEEFRTLFLAEHENAPAATYRNYATALRTVTKHCKVERLSDLTVERLDALGKAMREKGNSIATVRSYLNQIQVALNWAKSKKFIHEAIDVPMPKRPKGTKIMRGRPITGEEFDRMLDKIEAGIVASGKGRSRKTRKRKLGAEAMERKREAQEKVAAANRPAWERLLRGLWMSGLRLGEAVNLTWDDPAWPMLVLTGKKPLLWIPAACQKSGRDSLTPLTPDFYRFLVEETPDDQRKGLVFPLASKDGSRLRNANYVGRVISAAGRLAGIVTDSDEGRFATAHDLRRAFGCRWSLKVMPAVLKDLMRHQDISTTMKYYVGQNAEAMAAAIWAADDASPGSAVGTSVSTRSSDVQ